MFAFHGLFCLFCYIYNIDIYNGVVLTLKHFYLSVHELLTDLNQCVEYS